MIKQTLREELNKQISRNQTHPFTMKDCRPVNGGSINNSYKISSNDQTYFVKTNSMSFSGMFSAEAEGLSAIINSHSIGTPKPVCFGEFEDSTYLVMDYLELGRGNSKSIEQLGEQLAAMHRSIQPNYGWHINNTIGSTPQINTPRDSWLDFYREHRLRYQIDLTNNNGHNSQLLDNAYELLDWLGELLSHTPPPSLLHGDLWSGNYGVDRNGTPFIFDPAVYYGDRETDIAMTELFGGFPPRFYEVYWHHYPKEAEYEVRKTLYNLYHILNHLNLFGDGYASQAEQMISRLLSEVR